MPVSSSPFEGEPTKVAANEDFPKSVGLGVRILRAGGFALGMFYATGNIATQFVKDVGEGYIPFEYGTDRPVCPEKLLQREMAMEFSGEPIVIDDTLLCNQVVCQGLVRVPRKIAGKAIPFSGKKQCGIVRNDNL